MAGHPSDEALAGYLAGERLPAIERHLAFCERCLEDLLAMQRMAGELESGVRAPAVARERRWAWAAAAGLLVAAGGWVVLRQGWHAPRPKTDPPMLEAGRPSPPPSLSPMPASGLWQAAGGDAETTLGRSGYVALRRGGRVRVSAEEGVVDLEEGTLLVASRGEKVSVRRGILSAELEDGAIVVEAAGSGGALSLLTPFLREALAGEGALRVTVLEGSARLRWGSEAEERAMRSGESACLSASGVAPCVPVAWHGPAWNALSLGSNGVRAIHDAEETLLPSQPAGYVLEVLVRKRDPRAEVGVLFEAAGRGWTLLLGDNVLPVGEAWRRLRVEVGGGWCRVAVGAREVLLLPEGGVGRDAQPRASGGAGLRAWGGAIEVREARWRKP